MFNLQDMFWPILNFFAISIPEETFLVIFTLILLKRFDLLKPKLKNIVWVGIPVVFIAISTNLIRGFKIVNQDYMPFITTIISIISITFTYRVRNYKELAKVLICTILSVIVISIIQLSYIPLILYGTNIPVAKLNEYSLLSIMITLPQTSVEIIILALIFAKRARLNKVNLIKVISSSKSLTIVTLSVLAINVIFLCAAFQVTCVGKILLNLPFAVQLIAIEAMLLFPVLNITLLWITISQITDKEAFERIQTKERLKALTGILEVYAHNRKYDEVDVVVGDINKQVDEL